MKSSGITAVEERMVEEHAKVMVRFAADRSMPPSTLHIFHAYPLCLSALMFARCVFLPLCLSCVHVVLLPLSHTPQDPKRVPMVRPKTMELKK